MAYLRIQSQLFPDWNWLPGSATAKLRVFASQQFFEATTGAVTPQGQVGNVRSACQVYDCTVSGTNLTIPEVTVPTTTDSTVPNATLTFVLYDSGNVQRYVLLSQAFIDPDYFQVPVESSVLVATAGTTSVNAYYTYRQTSAGYPAYNVVGQSDSTTLYAVVNTGTQWRIYDSAGTNRYHTSDNPNFPWNGTWITGSGSTGSAPVPTVSESATTVTSTWEQLTLSNQAAASTGFPFQFQAPFWNVQETKQYINSQIGSGTTPYASSLVAGKTYLDVDPVSSSTPIAVGENSPRIPQAVLSIDYNNNIATAISSIGATPTELIVSALCTVTDNASIPSNILVTFVGTGSFTVASGKTLNIAKMTPYASSQIFFGAGTVNVAGSAVPQLNISWWAGISNAGNISTIVSRIMTSFATSPGTLFFGYGTWLMDDIVLAGNINLEGIGEWSILEKYDKSTAGCVLKIPEATSQITIQGFKITVGSSVNANCVLMEGSTLSSGGLNFNDVRFDGSGTNSVAQVKHHSLVSNWECAFNAFNNCLWTVPQGGIGFECDSINSSYSFMSPSFAIQQDGVGIKGGAGYLNIYNHDFRGTAVTNTAKTLNRTIAGSITSGTKALTLTSGTFNKNDMGQPVIISGKLNSYITNILSSTTATVHDNATSTATGAALDVYRYDANTGGAKAALWITSAHAGITMTGGADEGMNNFIIYDAGAYDNAISIMGATIQSAITMNSSMTLCLYNCHILSQILVENTDAVESVIYHQGGWIDVRTVHDATLDVGTIWGHRNNNNQGSSHEIFDFDHQYASARNYEPTFGERLAVKQRVNGGSAYELTRGVLEVSTVATASAVGNKPIIRLGYLDQLTDEILPGAMSIIKEIDGQFYFVNDEAASRGYHFDGKLVSSNATGGIGYATGAGGAQTQSTNKSTGVTSNTITTAITMNGAALAASTTVSFTFTNSTITATDQIVVTHQSAGTAGAYNFAAFPGLGSAVVSVRNVTLGSLSEAIVIRVSIYKAVSS